MLTDLIMARSALGRTAPDLSRHAAMQCLYGKLKTRLLDAFARLWRKPDATPSS